VVGNGAVVDGLAAVDVGEGASVVGNGAGVVVSGACNITTHTSTVLTLVIEFGIDSIDPPAQIRVCKPDRDAAAVAVLGDDSLDDHHTLPSPRSTTSTTSEYCCDWVTPPPHMTSPCCTPAPSIHSIEEAASCCLGWERSAVAQEFSMAL
jgi:hypothetical protein